MSWNQVCEPGLRCVMPFEAVPAELRLLRRKVRVTLGGWGATAISDEAELVVTELATNVIKHVGEGAAATLVVEPRRSRLRLEVHDRSHALPSRASAHCDAECGRGLHLLAAMSAECGTLLTATGKAVWCELDLEPLRYGVRVQRAAALIEEYRRMVGTASLVVPAYAALEESATEAIADLLHWLAEQGGDPDDVLDRAQTRYESDVEAA
ncbi:ATP-binding protein [Streptomyces sp. NPDC048200]|uniref:ATP-binding protein n=1 Tax=Streptomyces sp. NPDC048200 TaxID=3365512 RepID=UPI003714A32B